MRESKLYIFKGSSACIGSGPLDLELRPLSHKHKPWTLPRVAIRIPVLDDCPDIVSLDEAPDLISLGNSFTASPKAKACLDKIRLDPHITVVPAQIINRKGAVLGEDFWYWSTEWTEVLDRATASFTTYPGTDVIVEVNRWAIKWDSIPDVDLLCCESQDWIATDRLRVAMMVHGISGARFTPIN